MTTVIVLAKACVPGRVKTRLTPPFTPEEAAALAAAALADTMAAARRVRADRHLLWFDGAAPGAGGFTVAQQPAGGLDERIAAAFDAVDDRAVLIGMDTPQVDPAVLQSVLDDDAADAWFGPAADGGWWALGLDPTPRRGDLIRGVPMSSPRTGTATLARLHTAGLRVRALPELVDVDHAAEARAVAAAAPATRFAALLARLDRAGTAAA
ncbi:TIGR04282 family arsenosugar biosynthesis glycosyltransferase [Amnibacterium sp.]|uniref:TIGR04282 family arsenosugar biosynthesis glycosyltransferase n=1 Tax=Amnibacterium sp. TaxID=1872496 RepID=UPI003F7B4311